MKEAVPIPPLSRTAIGLAEQEHGRIVRAIALQTLQVMGLSPEQWDVDFDRGVVFRRAPQQMSQNGTAQTPSSPDPAVSS